MSALLRGKIINEMHRAQRQVVQMTAGLYELGQELKGLKKCQCQVVALGDELTELVDEIASGAGATMHLLTIAGESAVLETLRTSWGQLAEMLEREVSLKTVGAIRAQAHKVQQHLSEMAAQFLLQDERAKYVRGCRN